MKTMTRKNAEDIANALGCFVSKDGKKVDDIIEGLNWSHRNKGARYCPCMVHKTKDTICPCKPMREKQECVCGLFEKGHRIKIMSCDLQGQAFAAYVDGSIFEEGQILVDIVALKTAFSDESKEFVKRAVIETMMHELGHALENLFEVSYDEEKIEKSSTGDL